MRINLIAVYIQDVEGSESLKLLKFASGDKGFFSSNQVENLEKNLFPKIQSRLDSSRIIRLKTNNEYHYFEFQQDKHLFVISCRDELEKSELFYLFANIKHTVRATSKMQFSLDNIIANPIGYIGRDALIGRVTDELVETKKIMLINIEKIIERGESIDSILPKTIQLKDDAEFFRLRAKNINKCCRY